MKTKFRTLFIITAFSGLITLQSKAQTLIQFWDFNQSRPITGLGLDSLGTLFSYANTPTADSLASTWPLNADYHATAAPQGKILYSRPQTHYSSLARDSSLENGTPGSFIYDYSSVNYSYFSSSDSGFAGGNMFIRARNPSDSCTMSILIPTTGYKNITLDFAISASSSKGANYLVFAYSTNAGVTWKKLTQAMDTFNIGGVRLPDTLLANNTVTSTSSWYPAQIDFTSDPSVNNNPGFVVQMMLAGPNTVLGSGNTRFDNFAAMGTLIAGINEISTQAAGYSSYPNPTGDFVTINSSIYKGMKSITLYNVVGQTVTSLQNESKQTLIDMTTISSGVYFAEIKEEATGKKYTLKVIKN